ncbi:MAG TPA: nitrate- and nitrite sensing domain-containing protein [Trebonia sp.]|jgi:signal transduction histidine kinase|nr:nitrate- and nitrite sensing domain-containing protein [Trebonia sp.]
MTDNLRPTPRRRKRSSRRARIASIRIRVLAIALVPSVALLVTGAAVAGSLISDGLSEHSFAGYSAGNVGVLTRFEAAVENERTISLRAVGGNRQALAGLQAQWNETDAALKTAEGAVGELQAINPQVMASTAAGFRVITAELPGVRQRVRSRHETAAAVDAFYTQIVSGSSPGLVLNALGAPDAVAAVDAITMLDLFPPLDLHSRAVGLGAGWAERGRLTQPERLQVAQLTGAYRNDLQALAARLSPAEQSVYQHVTSGSAWRAATAGEDSLAGGGGLGVPMAGWLTAESTVSAGLLTLWIDSDQQSADATVTAANQTLSRAIWLGAVVLGLTIAAFAAALILANRLVGRLRRLRTRTLELADRDLPDIVARLGAGEPVDVESALGQLDYGSDEIGQVAAAFNAAQRTAVAAAAAEASTRNGISKVFLDIAHRSQLVVHRQLELLDVAEARQGDPEHLELLFQLDHLATRARRNAENLLILGGGQPGRRWRRSAAVEDVVRSAVSETEHFARVDTVRLPDARVQGAAVGDLIHLLAELVDNATAFSPPDAMVTVRGNAVGKGVVVEVEDQGLGIEYAKREKLNQTLRNPPGFQEMTVSGQRHIGLFVVGQLAQRHGITVSLQDSAYGGVKAIVLIPAELVETAAHLADGSAAPGRPGRHEQVPVAPARLGSAAAARPAGRDGADLPGQRMSPPMGQPGRAAALPPEPRRGHAPLARRERLANLAPGLQTDAAGTPEHLAPRRPRRGPDEARGAMSAFQRGSRLGRDSASEDKR